MAVRAFIGLHAAAILFAQAFSSEASAGEATFPVKPIRVIVASSPGGPNDVLARAIATPWSEILGRPVVVDNRAGAAGVIGTELGAKAPADGYTLLFGFQGPLVIAPHFNDTSPYQPLKDFAPVSLVAAAPYVLLVHPNVPAKSAKELIALAKARPGVLSTLERTLMQVLKDSTTNNRLTQLGFDVDGSGPETFRRLIREESELWNNVIKAAGLKRQG
jgi:tripartite-type tricarboxylate transporter receptor subunit TctC